MRGEFLKFALNEVEERRILEKPWFLVIWEDRLLIKCIKRCDMPCNSCYVERIQLQQIVVLIDSVRRKHLLSHRR